MPSDDSDEYRYHGEVYYERQWELLDDTLSEDHALLVKRVIREGEEQRSWAKNTARNHLRNIRFLFDYGVDADVVPDDPTEWDADNWNKVVSNLAIKRDSSSGQKRAYASAAKAFIWHCDDCPESLSRDEIKSPKQERTKVDIENVLSHEEVMELLENANNSRDRALIATLYQGGLRREAAVQINLRDYDDKGSWATVRIPNVDGVKGADGNMKPLTWAKGYIDSWLSDHPFDKDENPEKPLFCSVRKQDDGKRVTGHAVYTMMKRLAKQIDDIEDDRIHPHMLKHARATYMRASPNYDKKDIEQVMDWTESTPMHSRYSHADEPAEAARVAKKMGVDVGEEAQPEPFNCPRCNDIVPPAVQFCPSCGLKVDDEPPAWYGDYRMITDDDDPLRQKYDAIAGVAPPLSNLSKSEFEYAYEKFAFATLAYDALVAGQDLDDFDWVDEVDISDLDEEDANRISENWVSPSEPLAQNFRENETEYQLSESVTGLSPEELQEEVEAQGLEDDE